MKQQPAEIGAQWISPDFGQSGASFVTVGLNIQSRQKIHIVYRPTTQPLLVQVEEQNKDWACNFFYRFKGLGALICAIFSVRIIKKRDFLGFGPFEGS